MIEKPTNRPREGKVDNVTVDPSHLSTSSTVCNTDV